MPGLGKPKTSGMLNKLLWRQTWRPLVSRIPNPSGSNRDERSAVSHHYKTSKHERVRVQPVRSIMAALCHGAFFSPRASPLCGHVPRVWYPMLILLRSVQRIRVNCRVARLARLAVPSTKLFALNSMFDRAGKNWPQRPSASRKVWGIMLSHGHNTWIR